MIERIRAFFFTFRKLRLRNRNFSIIANNCIGGCVLHDFGQPFLTPTINLYIECPDYIKMLKNLKYYMGAELTEEASSERFPIGILGGGKTLFSSLSDV